MKNKLIRWCSVFALCITGIAAGLYITQKHVPKEIQAEEIPQTNSSAPITDEEGLNSTYEMGVYTEAQNKDSSIKIQYPIFTGNKAEEINTLILAMVQDIAWLDPSYFPENPKMTAEYQSAVTLQNYELISIVFWGTCDIEVSQFPTTNLYSITIDLQSLKLVSLKDLYTIDGEFEKIFFEKAFFPDNPVTSYNKEEFPEMLKLQTPEYKSISPFTSLDSMSFYLKPEGIVLSMPSVHASGSDHFEAELLYNDIQEYFTGRYGYPGGGR